MIKDLQKAAVMRDPEHGGRQSGGFAGRCYARTAAANENGAMIGFMGMGMANAVGGMNPQGLLRPGRQRPAKPVSRGGGRRLRGAYPEPCCHGSAGCGAYPRARCRGSAGCGPCCRWRCVDMPPAVPPTPASSAATAAAPSPCRPRPPVSGSARAVRRTPASSAVTAVAPSPQATAAGIASAASTAPARSAATAARSARKAAYARRAAGLRSARAAFVGPAGN